jgi:hypothetical protein
MAVSADDTAKAAEAAWELNLWTGDEKAAYGLQ